MSRHYFPSFAKLHVRAKARPDAGYDVMRTSDSWLAALLTDTIISIVCKEAPHVNWGKLPSVWHAQYRDIQKDLASWGWRANVDFYLHRQAN